MSSVPSTESDDDDADQIEVRFWLPFDSTDAHAITMDINGTFERGNLVNTNLTLDGSSISFRRGSDYTTRAYYLVAQTSYTFSLFGLATITELDQNWTSLTSDEYTFNTRELIDRHNSRLFGSQFCSQFLVLSTATSTIKLIKDNFYPVQRTKNTG